jgi:hypothetical protein
MPARSIAILLEGDGDYQSVPLLVRNLAAAQQYYDLNVGTRPIMVGDIRSIMESEKFLRLFRYAINRSDIDAVLVVADCEDWCPVDAVRVVYTRTKDIVGQANKPLGVALFYKEYETMFLVNAAHIAERCHSIQLDPTKLAGDTDWLGIRNAKGALRSMIVSGSYKETRDQARLTGAMDVQHCAQNYRPLLHLRNVIDWFHSWDGTRNLY